MAKAQSGMEIRSAKVVVSSALPFSRWAGTIVVGGPGNNSRIGGIRIEFIPLFVMLRELSEKLPAVW